MTATWNSLQTLLGEVRASVRVDPKRVVGTSLNDPTYNACISALTIMKLGTESPTGRAIDSAKLQLAQFAAARHSVLDVVLDALLARRRLPSGFATDRVHIATVEFLVARGLLLRQRNQVVAPVRGAIEALAARIAKAEMFADERAALDRLAALGTRFTKKAVELQ